MKDVYFDTVEDFNNYQGVKTLHPLVSVVRSNGRKLAEPTLYHYGVYALYLKENKGCKLSYGRTAYDFDEMTITSFAPGQTIKAEPVDGEITPKWTALVFHPDFLVRTSLGREMSKYEFFSYTSNEALHLSADEVAVMRSVLAIIVQEMQHAIDKHSRRIIVNNIEMLLNYCLRFYERQFVTREEINHTTVAHFQQLLNDYIDGEASRGGIPTVAYFADKCCLSPGYFGELVKAETGMTAQDFIAKHLMRHAEELLNDMSLTVTQVSQKLGFEYPQHFVRFFKRHAGRTPSQYRTA